MRTREPARQPCASDEELRRYHARESTPAQDEEMRGHLASCIPCADRARALLEHHESWVQRIRRVGRGAAFDSSADAAASRPTAATTIPGYEALEEIGRGGQGIVFRAVQTSTRRTVAIKMLREGRLASESAQRRFEREIELVAAFRHPGIVTVFDSGTTEHGARYCVMDFVAGVPLGTHVRDAKCGPRNILTLFAGVCDAVNYAHRHGVIHRDLKPNNILVDSAGQPRVLDFGLAKPAGAAAGELTETQVVAGTLPYLSPEQAGLSREVDIRSDVYALGVILYELLTGRYPYPVDGSLHEALGHIQGTPAMRLRQAAAASTLQAARVLIDGELETIVLKALAKDPQRRYQTAGDFAGDLRAYLEGGTIEAKRDSGWYVLKKTLQRYRAVVVTGVLFAALAGASAVALGVLYREANAARQAEAEQRQRAQRRFDELRDLARTFIFDFNGLIRDLPGSVPARELLLKTALKYVNSLAEELEPGDVRLQAELGAAYFELGNVQGHPHRPNLGNAPGALENCLKGLELIEAVAAAQPQELQPQRGLGLAYNHLGVLLESMNRAPEAHAHYERAREIFERLNRDHPADPQILLDLSFNYAVRADRHEQAGRLEDALEEHRRILKLTEFLTTQQSVQGDSHQNVASTHSRIAELLRRLGEPREALVHQRQAQSVLLRLTETHPHHAIYQFDLAATHERIGFLLLQANERTPAGEHFHSAVGICQALLELDPEFHRARRHLGLCCGRLGEWHAAAAAADDAPQDSAARREAWQQARTWYQRGLAHLDDLRTRGGLASDDSLPAEIAAEITHCDRVLEP